VNAGHDEEGVTHKPFQIAASGSVLVHHATSELEEYLESGRECLLFSRGPELLGHVRACGDDAFRRAMADAGLARCTRDHTWASRVASMLAYEG
jgi:spore maturation protein CgeB